MTYRQLLLLSFLLNGLLMVGVKAIDGFKLSEYIAVVLFVQYTVGVLMLLPYIVRKKQPISRTSMWVGALGGGCSAIGMAASMKATTLIPGYILFPITQGGTLLAVVFIGRLAFKEKLGAYGIAGILVGVAAIIFLSM